MPSPTKLLKQRLDALRVRETYRKNKSEDRPRTWHDVPHSPLPFKDGGAGVFVDANGHVPFSIVPFERRNENPGAVYERFKGDYHYIMCAANCHEDLLAAAKRLAVLLCKVPKKNAAELNELRTLIARADEHFW